MRHTAAPIERLRSLLGSLAEVAEGPDDILLRARAAKVRHLCRQIDEQACTGPIRPPANRDEARQVIALAISFLEEPKIAAKPPVALIYSIYACAVTLSAGVSSAAASPYRGPAPASGQSR
jgi:hypothetical protein